MQQQPDLTDVFERITDAFVALDKNWCYTYMNKKAGEIFNRDPATMIGKHIWTEFPESKEQAFYKAYYKATEEQRYVHLEEYYPPYDRWFENHIYPSPEGLSIFFRDITERKNAARLSDQNQAFIESIINASPDIIYIYDIEERKNIYANEGIKANLGYSEPEIKKLGDQVLPQLMHPADFEYYLQHTYPKYAVAKDKEIITHEFRMKDKEGSWHLFHCKESIFLRKQDGTPKQIFGIVNDITKGQLAEQELKQSKGLLEIAEEQVGLGSWEFEISTQKGKWSKQMFRLFGFDLADQPPPYNEYLERIHPDDRHLVVKALNIMLEGKDLSSHVYRTNPEILPLRYFLPGWQLVKDKNGRPVKYLGTLLDITESTKEKKEIKDTEERFRTLVEQASVSIFVYDQEGNFIEVNSSGEKLVGYTKQELLNLTVYDIVDPVTFNQVPFHYEQLLQGETVVTERKYVKKDGTVIDVEVSSKLLSNGYLQGIAFDITERKNTERELQNSNFRFEMIARATNDALWEWNFATGKLWANAVHQQLYGLTISDPVPAVEQWQERLHPADRDIILEIQKRNLNSDKQIFISEYRFRTANNEYRNIYDRCYIIRDADGQPLSMVGSMMDITEQKMAQQSLAEKERHLYTILQTETECIKQIGPNEELIDMNPAGLAMIEADNLEMVKGQSVMSIIAPGHRDAFIKLTKSVFEGKSGKLSFELIGLKGTHRWMETHAVPLKNTEGKIISLLGVTRDITENKKIQEQILREKDLSDSIINILPGIFYLYDENGKFLRWNKNLETVSGYSGVEIALMHPLDLFPVEEKELLTNRISKVFETGMAEVEAYFLTKNGEKIPYFFNGRKGKFDNKICLIGMGIDITVQKNAEEQKEFERRDKEALINSTHDLIWSVSKDLKLIAANQAFINSLIVSTGTVFKPGDEMLQQDIFPADQLSFWKGLYEQALTGEFFTKEIFVPATHNRAAFWLEINFSPVYNEKDITGLACYARDITERKKNEEDIRNSEEQRRLIMNAALDAIICIGIGGEVTFWNPQAENIFGWKEEEVCGRILSEIIIPESYRQMHNKGMENYFKTGEGPVLNVLLELKAINRQGQEFPIELTVLPIKQGDEEFFCAFIRDITERKKAEEKIYQLNQELEQRVKDRTADLEKINAELEEINDLFVGREARIIELKEELKELKNKYGLK